MSYIHEGGVIKMNENKINQLLERISQLESKVNQMSVHNIANALDKNNDEGLSDKLKSRQRLLETIKSTYPGVLVTIAKRQDGGGLLLINKHNNQSYRVKCYYSRNYSSQRIFGWFSVRSVDIFDTPYDFYAMSLDFNEKNHVFMFSQKQMQALMNDKQSLRDHGNQTDRLEHLYIEDNKGTFYETREIDKNLDEYRGLVAGGFDVTYAYQNLDVIQEILGNIKEDSNKPFVTHDISIIKSKVHEILYNKDKFVVVLNRKDFFYRGNLYQYIEMDLQENDLSDIDFKNEDIKLVVVHIRTHANTPLVVIHNKFTEVDRLFDGDVLKGVSINDQESPLIQIFILTKKEVI